MSRATDQRAGLDEVDGASLISQAGVCRGADQRPDSGGVGVVSRQLGPHLPECRASSAKRPPKGCQDLLAARLVSSEASLNPRLGRKSGTQTD